VSDYTGLLFYGYSHHRGPQKPAVEQVSLSHLVRYCILFNLVGRLRSHSLVKVGIEFLPLGLNRLESESAQGILKLFIDQLETAGHIFSGASFGRSIT